MGVLFDQSQAMLDVDILIAGSPVAFDRESGEAEKDTEGLRTVDQFAENLVWLTEKLG